MDKRSMPNEDPQEDFLTDSLTITNPLYKYGLMAFLAATLAAITWGIFGSIPHKVEGIGEITLKRGLTKIIAAYPGQVQELKISLGGIVQAGDTLLIMRKPEIEQQLVSLQSNLKLTKAKSLMLLSGNSKSDRLRDGVNQLEIKELNAKISEVNSQIHFYEEKVNKEDKLYKDGLITYSQLFATKNNLSEIRTELVELEKQLSNVSLREEEWTLGKTLNEEDLKHEITKLEVDLENLQKEYDLQRFIFAPADGRVVQVATSVPDFVEAGELLVELEKRDASRDFVLDLYVPFNANALISKGMAVDVEPFIVDRNLYGWLIGKVMDVDEYVSSHNSLLADLENQELSGLIERNGPVYKVTVELEKNKSTDSGFSWTNKKGPPFKINSGSLARSFIHVKDKAPIDYLIPIFKEYFE